jgi:hypothetical protein
MQNGICGRQISSLIEQQRNGILVPQNIKAAARQFRTYQPLSSKSFHQCRTFVSVSSGVSSHTDNTTTNIEGG